MANQELFDQMLSEFMPIFRKLSVTGDFAVTLGGSHGKGVADASSDYDFRLYCEELAAGEVQNAALEEAKRLARAWKEKGFRIDDDVIWPRTYADVDAQLEQYLSGKGQPPLYFWTLWGYQVLTDINNQSILSDPSGKVAAWLKRLSAYPAALKKAIIGKHGFSLRYWRGDYHYQSKVKRGDAVFLASITARLVHDMMQVVFALNEFYFPGDGGNLKYAAGFAIKPPGFEEKVTAVFRLSDGEDAYQKQYEALTALIDEVLALIR